MNIINDKSGFTYYTVNINNMKIICQEEKLQVSNIDGLTVDGVNGSKSKHGNLLPDTIRCIISGPSNCGKTNLVFNMLTNINGLHFKNVYIFSKSLHQPKYQLMEKVLSDVSEITLFKFDANEDVIDPQRAKPYSVFIFDDVSAENQNMVMKYFTMGRHYFIDSIYIGQTYSKIPKQLIRDNVNFLILFKQDDTNLKHVYSDHIGADMSFTQFKDICGKAWKEKYGFLVIDKDKEGNNGRYRLGFHKFVILN